MKTMQLFFITLGLCLFNISLAATQTATVCVSSRQSILNYAGSMYASINGTKYTAGLENAGTHCVSIEFDPTKGEKITPALKITSRNALNYYHPKVTVFQNNCAGFTYQQSPAYCSGDCAYTLTANEPITATTSFTFTFYVGYAVTQVGNKPLLAGSIDCSSVTPKN